MTLDPPLVLSAVKADLQSKLERLLEKNVKVGEGRNSTLRGAVKRSKNRFLVETISLSTLRSMLRPWVSGCGPLRAVTTPTPKLRYSQGIFRKVPLPAISG